ncbi:MAG: CBS domain-containing protein [Chloroflexi bacterium]|nr:CBS domain-containing protein [Chloroflexota bacterium]
MTNESSSQNELLVVILDDLEKLPDLLNKLYEVGVPGVTLLDSVGGRRAHSWMEDLGLGGLARLFHVNEIRQRTLLAIMPADMVDAAVAASEQAVGDFSRTGAGLLFTVPLGRVVGLCKTEAPEAPETAPVVSREDLVLRDLPVAEAAAMLHLEPVTVFADAPLSEVTRAMLRSPSAHVVAVVSETGHLVGIVTLRDLADKIFFGVMPELFFGEVHDRDQAESFVQMAATRLARDCMIDPVAVHADDPISAAFRLMHEHRLPALPVVDDENRVVGVVSLLELLALTLRMQGEETTRS